MKTFADRCKNLTAPDMLMLGRSGYARDDNADEAANFLSALTVSLNAFARRRRLILDRLQP